MGLRYKIVRLGKTYFNAHLNFMCRCHGASVKTSFVAKLKNPKGGSHLPVAYNNKILSFV